MIVLVGPLGSTMQAKVITNLLFCRLLPVGRALRFFGAASGTGVSRGLAGLGLALLLMLRTPLAARSMAAPPFGAFSTFLRFGGGFPFTAAVPDMPSPTVAGGSAGGFRDLGAAGFLAGSALGLPSWSSKSESWCCCCWFLRLLFAATACLRASLRAAASSAIC